MSLSALPTLTGEFERLLPSEERVAIVADEIVQVFWNQMSLADSALSQIVSDLRIDASSSENELLDACDELIKSLSYTEAALLIFQRIAQSSWEHTAAWQKRMSQLKKHIIEMLMKHWLYFWALYIAQAELERLVEEHNIAVEESKISWIPKIWIWNHIVTIETINTTDAKYWRSQINKLNELFITMELQMVAQPKWTKTPNFSLVSDAGSKNEQPE